MVLCELRDEIYVTEITYRLHYDAETFKALFHHLHFPLQELFFVLECANYAAASQHFLPIRVDWSPKSLSDLVQLIVS